MNEIQTNLLEETKQAFQSVRGSTIVAAAKLHEVKESAVWESVATSWGEYVESELQISQGFASKLLTMYKAWVLEAKVSPEKLAGTDYEKLYLAAPQLEGNDPEEVLARAKTLTRRELRETNNEEKPHEHEPISVCKHCGIRL